jgi:hypothetical protein
MLNRFTATSHEPVGDILKRAVSQLSDIHKEAVIEIRVHDRDARDRTVYSLHLTGSDATLRTEPAQQPSLVVIVGADTLRQIAEGLYSPVKAYLDGNVKLGGDVELGKQVILNLDHSGSQVDACTVPSSHLVSWKGYPTTQPFSQFSHFLVLKCTYSDDRTTRALPPGLNPAITDLDTYIDLFLSLGGIGTGNLIDYYRDVSYGGIDIETTIAGWFDAPFATADGHSLGRAERIQQAANAVPDSAGIEFGLYDGIILVTNTGEDGGAAAVGKQPITIKGNDYHLGLVTFDSYALWTSYAAQEVGHALGLSHSTDTHIPVEDYRDPFDIMSTDAGTKEFGNPNYPPFGNESGPNIGAGPGMNVPNLLTLGALPSNRLAVFEAGSEVTDFTIAALSHPEVEAPLGIKIVNPDVPNDSITIEYRESDGWDQGFGANTVLIHEYRVGNLEIELPSHEPAYSFLQRHADFGDGLDTGMWQEGYLWENDNYPFRNLARVAKIDPVSHTAIISVNSLSN